MVNSALLINVLSKFQTNEPKLGLKISEITFFHKNA